MSPTALFLCQPYDHLVPFYGDPRMLVKVSAYYGDPLGSVTCPTHRCFAKRIRA